MAREEARKYGVSITEKDDAISIFGKVVGLKKQQVIRLFSEIGWRLYYRRAEKVRAKARDSCISRDEAENVLPAMDDLEFFDQLQLLVALARGIPHGLQMRMHPRFQEYTYFFSLAIYQFAYCYPHVNNCSQEGLCWLMDGLH
jgi:hypothetical protein